MYGGGDTGFLLASCTKLGPKYCKKKTRGKWFSQFKFMQGISKKKCLVGTAPLHIPDE